MNDAVYERCRLSLDNLLPASLLLYAQISDAYLQNCHFDDAARELVPPRKREVRSSAIGADLRAW